jgi:hypothetical protein
MNQLDVRREEIAEREAVERVRVPAAHLHNAEVPIDARQTAHLLGHIVNQPRITKFVDILHDRSGSGSKR